jgi:hypothetical protein
VTREIGGYRCMAIFESRKSLLDFYQADAGNAERDNIDELPAETLRLYLWTALLNDPQMQMRVVINPLSKDERVLTAQETMLECQRSREA